MPGSDRTAVVRMRAEFDQAIREWDKLTGAAQRSATAQAQAAAKVKRVGSDVDSTSASLGRGGAAWLKYGAVAAGAIAGIGIKELVQNAVTLEATFSKTMAQVAVATEAPADELKRLDDLALQLGADTIFSANDAAGAMLSLAKGGLSVAQIEAGALADTLTLAAAGEMELGQAADVVVQAMGAFQLGASDTDTAVAALAGGANASSASLQDMSMALSQTGTSANASGLSIQETTAYLALFADQGFKGSDAGTSLRTMLTRLVPQTKEAQQAMDALGLSYVDGNGQLVDATEIAARTQKAFAGLSDAERSRAVNTIFGADAQRAINAITVSGEAGLRKYLQSTNDLTQAQKLAEAANSGTAGALENLSGAAETALIKLGRGLAPTVQAVAGDIAGLLESGDIEAWGAAAGETISDLVDELSPLAADLVEIGQDALPAVGTALQTAGAGFQLVLDVVGPVVDMFSKLPDSAQQALLLAGAANVVGGKFEGMQGRVQDAAGNFDKARAKSAALRVGLGGLGVGLSTLGSEMGDTGGEVGNLLQIFGSAATGFAVGGPWGAAVGGAIGLVGALGESHKNVVPDVEALSGALDQQTGKLTENARAMVVNALQKNDAFKKGRELGIDAGTITDAALGEEKALKRIREARQAAKKEYLEAVREGNAGFEDIPSTEDFDKLSGILGDQSDALNDARQSWQDEADAKRKSIELNKVSEDQIKSVRAALHEQGIAAREVPNEVVTQFTTPGYEKAEQNAVDVARKYKLTPKQVTTVLRALDYSTEQIDAVLAAMRRTDGKVATVAVRLDENNTTGQLLGIGRTIRGLDGSTATVYTRHVQKGNPNTGSRQIGGGTTAEADGGILSFFANGGFANAMGDQIMRYADGGMKENHVAQIAPAGTWRVWAEDETGGEAYIPLAQSKRPRSMEIWRQTGRLLGAKDTDFYAGGGISSSRYEALDEQRASRLEIARMEQRIIQLQRDLRSTEKYGKGDKKRRPRLRGKDRQVAQLELVEARNELRAAQRANALEAWQRRRGSSLAKQAEAAKKREDAARDKAEQAVRNAEQKVEDDKRARDDAAQQLNQAREQRTNDVQSAAGSFARAGDISSFSSPERVSRNLERTIGDMSTFVGLLIELKGKGASPWLLQQLQAEGPTRGAIRFAQRLIGDTARLNQLNAQAAELQQVSNAYGAITTGWGAVPAAQGFAVGGSKKVDVAVTSLDMNRLHADLARLVRQEVSVLMAGSG